MTKAQDKLFDDYAALTAQIEELESKKEELKQKVLKLLEEKAVDTLQLEYGTFSVVYRSKYEYTEEVKNKELMYSTILKDMKKEEELNGEAKRTESKGLMYRVYKPDEPKK